MKLFEARPFIQLQFLFLIFGLNFQVKFELMRPSAVNHKNILTFMVGIKNKMNRHLNGMAGWEIHCETKTWFFLKFKTNCKIHGNFI